MRKFLTENDLRLQDRLEPYKEQLCSNDLQIDLSSFYDIVKKVTAPSAYVNGLEEVLPEVDVTYNYSENKAIPVFDVTLEAHKGATKWRYAVTSRVACRKSCYGEDLYNVLYTYLADMSRCLVANYNADLLTELVAMYVPLPSITFYIGSGVDFVRNTSISLGIAEGILLNVGKLLQEISDLQGSIRETFEDLPCILECKKRRTEFALKFGLYTMKSTRTLLKKAYWRKITSIRNDIGLYEKDGLTSLVECIVCSTEEMKSIRNKFGDKCYVVENSHPKTGDFIKASSKQELEKVEQRLIRKGISYKILSSGDEAYKVLVKQYLCYRRVFGPINLDTYTTESGTSSVSDLFQY